MITVPPRHGKSMLTSQYFPAWFLGTFPDRRVILSSYEADFATGWGRKARDVLEEHGEALFGVRVRSDSSAAHRWDLAGRTGGMVTAGVGGPITGWFQKGTPPMANLRRVPYTKPIPAGAEIIKHKGEPHARYKDKKGKTHLVPLTEDGRRIRLLSKKWYGEYKDADGNEQCVPLSTDKTAAEQMLATLVRQAEPGRAGISDPYAEHRKRPLTEHLADYRSELEARGNAPRYTALVVSRLEDLLQGCGFVFTPDLSASRVMDWLADLRRKSRPRVALEPGKEDWTRKEVAGLLGIKPASVPPLVRRHRLRATGKGKARRYPRATVEALQDLTCRGANVETTNQYLRHLKSFCKWLVKDGRLGENPAERLEAGNASVDRRHDRRELDSGELQRLLTAARDSGRTFRGLSGPDRFHLYATACGTGFRASALASLTPESFELAGDPATVTLAARRNKSRKLKVQPLPPDAAELLRGYLAGKPAGQPVWGGTWAQDRVGADMLRIDLEAAGIPYAVEGPDGPLYADFHALRHSYLTLGGRAGIDLRTLQELAGHSTSALTERYSHRRLHDLAGAVEKLPPILPPARGESAAQPLAATGTDGGRPPKACAQLAPQVRLQESGCGWLRLWRVERGGKADWPQPPEITGS
jgi:site-specific recombinase XerC